MTLTLLPVSALAARSSREDQPLAEIAKGEEILDRAEEAAAKPAAATEDGNVAELNGTGYATLQAAIDAAGAGQTVTLLKDVVLDKKLEITQPITLNLNGHKISRNPTKAISSLVVITANTTIQDTVGTGAIETAQFQYNGKTYGTAVNVSGVELTIKSGTIDGGKIGIAGKKSATINLTGGAVKGQTGVDMQGGTITVSENAEVNAVGYGISLQNDIVSDANTAAKLIMTGGAVKANTTNGQAICGNNLYSQGTVASISGGTVTGGTGVYWPMGGTLTVSGDAQIEGTLAGIEAKQGTINIEGGTIKATGDYVEYAPSGNGTVGSGWALAVSTQQYATTVAGVSSDVVVNVTGGELISVQGTAIETINMGLKETDGSISVSGNARVIAAEGKDAIHTASGNQSTIGSKNVALTVTGGTFSSDVSAYVTNNADIKTENGVTTVTMPTEPNWETHSDKALWLKESNTYFGANEMKALLVEANKLPSATVFCKPDAQITSYSHMHVTTNLTVYGNNATVTGGEQDFELDTYDDTGRAGTSITKDITLHVENLHGIAAWGQRHSAHTLDLEFVGCQDMNRVYFTGTTGTNNIKLTNCGVNETVLGGCAVYSNAPGEITLEGCAFEGVHEPINLNHKSTGEQHITVKSCTFTNCNSGTSDKLWAAPIRVLSTVEGGSSHLTVDSCTFTNSGDANGDILLGEGRTGNKSYLVTAEIKNTAAEVQIQNPGDRTETTNNSEKVTVAATETAALTNAAAEIDGVKYTTLQAALTAANAAEDEAGRTVTLLTGDKQTIDLSNYGDGLTNVTLTAAEGVTVTGIAVRSAGSMSGVTFRGIDFNATDNPCVDFELNDNAVENITFDDCSFTSNGQQMAIRMYRNTGRYQNITVTNCEFNDCSQGVYAPAVNTLAVSGCTFNSVGIAVHPGDVGFGGTVSVTNNTFDYCGNDVIAFNNDDGATGTITGNTSTHGLGWSRVGVSDGKTDSFTVSGNTWDGYADGADNVGWTERMVYWGDMYVHYYRVPAAAQVLDAEGQMLYGTLPSVETAVTLAESGQTIRILAEGDYDITGLAENVTVTVPDGYVQKTEGNTLTVVAAAAQVIAATDGAVTSYATVTEALAASNPGDTVKVLALPEEMVEIPNEKAVRLDCSEEVANQKPEAWNAYSVQDWLAAHFDYQARTRNSGGTGKFALYGGVEAGLAGENTLRVKGVAGGTTYGVTIVDLLKDWALTGNVTLPSRSATTTSIYALADVTVDLNGNTLEQEPSALRDPSANNSTTAGWDGYPAIIAYNDKTVTVKDSSANKTGKVIGSAQTFDVYPGATLNLESGTFTTKGNWYDLNDYGGFGSIVRMDGGTLNISGGKLTIPENNAANSVKMAATIMLRGKVAENPTRAYAINITGGVIGTVPESKRAPESFKTVYSQTDGFVAINRPVITDETNPDGKNITYSITGGTFDMELQGAKDATEKPYLGTGYASPEDPSNEGHFTVTTCTHEDTTVTREDVHEATCTEDGSYVEVTTCNTCGNVTRANKTIGKLGHNTEGSVAHKDATCTEPGVVGGVYCTRCNNGKEAAETAISALGHDLTKWAHDDVNHWHVCSRCDADVTDTPAAHTWVQGTVSGGRRTDTCECGAERTVSVSTGGNSRPRPTPPEEDLNEPDVPLVEKPFLFTDVTADDWYYDAVKYVSAANMMIGVNAEGTLFAPALSTTRASVAQILFRLEKEPTAPIADFDDVREGAWYTDAVNWNDENGLMVGYGDGTFRPDVNVTREQLVTVLYRYAKHLGLDVTADGDLSAFDDADEVAAWAEDAMAWAVNVGIIKGRNGTRLAPDGTASRSELASILQRFQKLTADAEA